MKSFLASVLTAVVLTLTFHIIPVIDKYETYAYNRQTVKLLTDGEGNGSGVMVAPHRMLTAAHVAIHPGLRVDGGGPVIKVLKIDEDKDLALVEVANDCPCALIGDVAPEQDRPVYVIGYPAYRGEQVQVLTEGQAQGLTVRIQRTTAPVAFGNSGGGLFYGEYLIGILSTVSGVSTGFNDLPVWHLSNSVDVYVIREFLKGEGIL